MMLALKAAVALALLLCTLLGFAAMYLRCRSRSNARLVVGFFHPYCNSGGGGERVLWCAVKALADQLAARSFTIVIFTGDVGVPAQEILDRVRSTFNIELPGSLDLRFVYLEKRPAVEAVRYPRFTLLGQSLGSIVLGWEALSSPRGEVSRPALAQTGLQGSAPL